MKYLIFIHLMTFSLLSFSQNVNLVLKSKSVISTKITATSSGSVFTPNGTFNYSEIDSAKFELKDQKWQDIYDRLESNSVKVSFTGYQSLSEMSRTALANKIEQKPISDVYIMLDKFASQRNTGKALQLLGIAAIGLSILSKDEKTIKAVSIGGAVVSTVGFVIDFDASRHLRLKGIKQGVR